MFGADEIISSVRSDEVCESDNHGYHRGYDGEALKEGQTFVASLRLDGIFQRGSPLSSDLR